MKVHSKFVAGLAALTLSFSVEAGIIDLFSTSQGPFTDTTPNGIAVGGSIGGGVDLTILGGERDLSVNLKTASGGNDATIRVAGGFMSFNTQALSAATGVVQWDGADGSLTLDPKGLGGVDLTAGGNTAVRVDVVFADAGFKFAVEAYTDADTFTKILFTSTGVAFPPGEVRFIPFTAFTTPFLCGVANPAPGVELITCGADGNVDLANLGALQLIIDPLGVFTALDLSIDQITTVPEPGTLALIGAALLGAGSLRLRRRKA